MKVKVSNTLASYINNIANKRGMNIEATVKEMSENSYMVNVGSGSLCNADYYGDYNIRKNVYKVIMVTYPYYYYAMPTFITTEKLYKEYKHRQVSSIDEFDKMLMDIVAI